MIGLNNILKLIGLMKLRLICLLRLATFILFGKEKMNIENVYKQYFYLLRI